MIIIYIFKFVRVTLVVCIFLWSPLLLVLIREGDVAAGLLYGGPTAVQLVQELHERPLDLSVGTGA